MLTQVRFSIEGEDQYARAFELMEHEAGDMSDPLEAIGEHIIRTVGDQFLTEGARTGTRWHPLSRAYDRWKDEHFPDRPLLVREGAMRSAALDRRRALWVGERSMRYTIHDDKAIHHQRGDGHMPQRKLVDLGIADRREWDRIFADWLTSIRRGPLRPSNQRRA